MTVYNVYDVVYCMRILSHLIFISMRISTTNSQWEWMNKQKKIIIKEWISSFYIKMAKTFKTISLEEQFFTRQLTMSWRDLNVVLLVSLMDDYIYTSNAYIDSRRINIISIYRKVFFIAKIENRKNKKLRMKYLKMGKNK